MPSPVIGRLCDVMNKYGIETGEHYRRYGPQHFKMYDLLKTQGLMQAQSRLADFEGTDGLPAMVELPFKEENVTIFIMPPNNGKHRVFVKCDCGKAVPFGRLYQHKCK